MNIKFFSIVLVIVGFLGFEANAQRAFDKGDVGINLGVGLGRYVNDLTPAVNFSLEVGLFPVGNAGVIALGGYSDVYVNSNGVYPSLSARGIFHLGVMKTNKFDLYGGAGTGFGLYKNGDIYLDAFVGARILLSRNFGLFAEAGYGGSNLKGGICWIL